MLAISPALQLSSKQQPASAKPVCRRRHHHHHHPPPHPTPIITRRATALTIARASNGEPDADARLQAAIAKRAPVLERVDALSSKLEASPLVKTVEVFSNIVKPVAGMLRGAVPPSSTFEVDVAAHLVGPKEDKAKVLAQLGPVLDVRVTGTGPRLAFFHHGFGGRHEAYTWAVEALAGTCAYTVVDYERTDTTSKVNNRLTSLLGVLPAWVFAPLEDAQGWLAKVFKATRADECAFGIVEVLFELLQSRTVDVVVDKAIKAEVAAFPLLLKKLRADGKLGAAGDAGGGIIMVGHSRGGGVSARLLVEAEDLGLTVDGAFLLDPIDVNPEVADRSIDVSPKVADCSGTACTELRQVDRPPRDRVAVVGAEQISLFNTSDRNYKCFLDAVAATPEQRGAALLRRTLHSTFMDFGAGSTNIAYDAVCGKVGLLQAGKAVLPRAEMVTDVRARYGVWETQLGGVDLVGAGDE